MSAAPFDRLLRKIHWRAKLAGLTKAPPSHVRSQLAPENAGAFVSEYAWILVVPVDPADPARITNACADAHQCFRDAFDREPDRDGTVTDGYAVLALMRKPDDACAEAVRTAELSTAICRKHVVWWDGAAWQRVDAITVLSPPKPPRTGGRVAFPTLPEKQWTLAETVRANVKDAITQTLAAGGFEDTP